MRRRHSEYDNNGLQWPRNPFHVITFLAKVTSEKNFTRAGKPRVELAGC